MRAPSGTKEPDAVADLIIHHPAVRTMLLTQKAIAEGGRSMVYECAKVADHMQDAEAAGDAKAAKECDERLAFLTPILKGFLSEMGKEAADLGIQAYGGHGYIKDNKAEQVRCQRAFAPLCLNRRFHSSSCALPRGHAGVSRRAHCLAVGGDHADPGLRPTWA